MKQNGIDVWRDEEGSSKIGKMTGDIMEKMAEVVSKSTVFIVCLSEAYKRRPNCRSEGGLIRRKQMKGIPTTIVTINIIIILIIIIIIRKQGNICNGRWYLYRRSI